MKKMIIFQLLILVVPRTSAQDVITTNNGYRFNVWVVAEDPASISCILPEDLTQEKVRRIDRNLISSIKYATVKLDENRIDEFTGDLIRTTPYTEIGKSCKGSIRVSLRRINDLYILQLNAGSPYGNECLLEFDSKVLIMLENNEILSFYQASETNCGEYISGKFLTGKKEIAGNMTDDLYISYQQDRLQKLRDNKWVKLRVYYSGEFVDYSPARKNSGTFFIEHLKALERPVVHQP